MGDRRRYMIYKQFFNEKPRLSKSDHPVMVNVTHNMKYFGCSESGSMPALLRRSNLVDLRDGSPLLAIEHFLVHGYSIEGIPGVAQRWVLDSDGNKHL